MGVQQEGEKMKVPPSSRRRCLVYMLVRIHCNCGISFSICVPGTDDCALNFQQTTLQGDGGPHC